MARLSETFLNNDRAKDATAWVNLRGGVRMKIAWFYSEAFQKALSNKDSDAKRVFAEHLVLDWENLEDDEGNPLECNVENRAMVLTEYAEIFGKVYEFSREAGNFIGTSVEDEVGN